MSMKKSALTLISFFLLISTVYADVGIPMLMLIWPMYWILLLPVIFIESWIFKRSLPTIPFHKIFWPTTVANLASTLIGIPITWGLLVLIELFIAPGAFPNLSHTWKLILGVTIQAPWVLPYGQAIWMIPVAAMFLLIPFYFVSAWIESFILTKFFNISPDRTLIKRISWKANLGSYLFLFLFCLGFLAYSIYLYFQPKPEVEWTPNIIDVDTMTPISKEEWESRK